MVSEGRNQLTSGHLPKGGKNRRQASKGGGKGANLGIGGTDDRHKSLIFEGVSGISIICPKKQ